MIKHVIILAAGGGGRMLPLTLEIPKAMVPCRGKPLIKYPLDLFEKIENRYVTIGHLKEVLRAYLDGKVSDVINTEGKGNAWWLYNSLIKHIDEPIFVSVCDSIFHPDFDLNEVYEDYKKHGSPACMIIPTKHVEGIEGDFINKDKSNKITSLQRENNTGIYGAGIQILNPAKINKITGKCDDFLDVWNQIMEKGELYCSNVHPKTWVGIDSLENLRKFENLSEEPL